MITVLMPTFNAEKYIKEAMESILVQTYSNFEFLIIDGGSKDKTISIIKSISDDRIRLIENSDGLNFVDSLNLGIELANGKYIARMDADDLCNPSRFQIQYDFLESNHHITACSTWLEFIGDQNNIVKLPVKPDDIYLRFLITNCFGHGPSMIRRDFLIKNNIRYNNNYYYSEDTFYWVEIMKHGVLETIPQVLYQYRRHDTQMTSEKRAQMTDSTNRAKNIHFNNFIHQIFNKKVSYFNLYQTTTDNASDLKDIVVVFDQILKENRLNKNYHQNTLKTTLLTICKTRLLMDELTTLSKTIIVIKSLMNRNCSSLKWSLKMFYLILKAKK